MKKYGLIIAIVVLSLGYFVAFSPPPTTNPVPTATADAPTMTIQPTGTDVPVISTVQIENTPSPLPVATPTNVPATVTLQPSTIPSEVPGVTAVFTITNTAVTTINTKEPEKADTPTPQKKIYFTYVAPKTTAMSCVDGGTCGAVLNTDTIVNQTDLRVRIINTTGTKATLSVTMKLIDTDFSTTLQDSPDAGKTGEVVFIVPCYPEATFIQLTIGFPGYTAVQTIAYPECYCQGK